MAITTPIQALTAYDVPAAQATAYTVGAGVTFRIDQAVVVNYTGTSQMLTVYILQNGDSVADLNKRIDALSIPAHSNVPLFELIGETLDSGGIINAFASAASSLALTINGSNFSA